MILLYKKMKNLSILATVFVLSFIILTACGEQTTQQMTPTIETIVPTTEFTPTLTPIPTLSPTPTPGPQGSAENPIVLGMVYADQTSQESAANEFLQYLADNTGLVFQVTPFDNTFDLLAGMDAGNVTFAYMQPLTYLYAYRNEVATIQLITRSFAVTAMGTQFLVSSDSTFSAYFDEEAGKNTVDINQALGQFSGYRPCFVDKMSASGSVVPVGMLTEVGATFSEPVYLLSNTAVIRALYIGGICDFGVTYAISSDPRTSPSLLEELPDVMEKVVIAWRSDAIIPTLNVAFANKSNNEITAKIVAAIEAFSLTENGPAVLTALTAYQVDAVEKADNTIYTALNKLVDDGNIDLVSYLGQ